MKLLTHNMLTSACLKNVKVGYPLEINATEVKVNEVDYCEEFTAKVIPKLDWSVLYKAAEKLGHSDDLPKELPEDWEKDEKFLKNAHKAILGIEIMEGELICPETGRKFPINEGIPNMLLNEAEADL